MNRKFLKQLSSLIFTVILLCPLGISRAETLEGILNDVMATNPQILEKQKEYNAALAELKDARGEYFPKVIFTGNLGYKTWRDSETAYDYENDGFYDARLTISQMLYDGGKTSAYEKARKSYMLSCLYAYVSASSQAAYDTVAAYFNVLKYNELQDLALKNVLTHENLLESIKMQVENGKKGRSALERINGRVATAQSRLLLSQNNYKKAVYNLHKILGRFVNVEDMTMPKMDDTQLPSSLKQSLDLQVRYHPMLREAFYNISQKEYEHKAKKSDYAGRLSLEGSASVEDEFDSSDDYEVDARIGLRYRHTLFDAGRSHQITAAISQTHKEQQKGYRVRRTLLNDIQLSWAAHKLLSEQISVLKKNLYFTRKTLESYKEEFVLGRKSLINILDAQNEYQYVTEQLANAMYEMELEKYKVMHSEGLLLEKLGLLNEKTSEMLKNDTAYVPLAKDTLPLNHDFDGDGVEDAFDVSVNSLKDTKVTKLGINKQYDTNYIYETRTDKNSEKENIIQEQDALKDKPMGLNIPTRFTFNAFVPGSTALSKTMKDKMMKELVKQAKAYSVQTPLYITVSTNEYDNDNDNYNLALKRAYNLKRILQKHRLEDNGIFVFANTNAEKNQNILRLKFTGELGDYKNQYRVNDVPARVFTRKENRIENMAEIDNIINIIKNTQGKVEIILYANELKNKEDNRELVIKRAALLTDYLEKQGLSSDKVVVFPWGGFREDPLLPESRKGFQFMQYVIR